MLKPPERQPHVVRGSKNGYHWAGKGLEGDAVETGLTRENGTARLSLIRLLSAWLNLVRPF